MENNNNNNALENEEVKTEESKSYTHEEVLALIQSEADKRVQQALKTQQKKFEKQLSLSSLDGVEREKAEKDSRIAELEEMVAQFNVERNKSELRAVLSSRNLSAEFADIIAITDDVEANQANIEKLDKLFRQAVKAEVERKLAGDTPKNGGMKTGEITKESVKKMSLAELQSLKDTQPELYKNLFN